MTGDHLREGSNEKGRKGLRMQEGTYQRKSMILESCVEEEGTRGKILGLGEKRNTVSQRKRTLCTSLNRRDTIYRRRRRGVSVQSSNRRASKSYSDKDPVLNP
jgi:hypothetical protein